MRLNSSLLLLAFATLSMACAPAPQSATGEKVADPGYDLNSPLPDDTSVEGEDGPGDTSFALAATSGFYTPSLTSSQRAAVLAKYNYVDSGRVIRTSLLQRAIIYFDANKSRLRNTKYLSVLDFSKPSTAKRLHVINMSTGSVWSLHVAHGVGSDANHDAYAERFSNSSGSHASSIGVYLTAETYYGGKGYSLRLDGLSSTNSAARPRAIVVHGASYVRDSNVKQGRSWGCPAVSNTNNSTLINRIKGGSLIYASNT